MGKNDKQVEAELALFPADEYEREYVRIPLSELPPNEDFQGGELPAHIASNIRKAGLRRAIEVTETDAGWYVLDGTRRIKLFRKLGRPDIPAIWVKGVQEKERLAWVSSANRFQSDNPKRDAEVVLSLVKLHYSAEQIAAATGLTKTEVNRLMSFSRLPDAIQQGVQEGKVKANVALEIAKRPEAFQARMASSLEAKGKLHASDVKQARTAAVTNNLTALALPPMILPEHPGWYVWVDPSGEVLSSALPWDKLYWKVPEINPGAKLYRLVEEPLNGKP